MMRNQFTRRPRPLLAALCAVLFVSGCATLGPRLQPPDISLVNIRPLAGTGFEQQFEITLRVLNPNSVPLEGDGLDVILDVNGQRLGRALRSEPFTIPRLGDETIKLVATTSLLDVFRQAFALPNARGTLEYALKGRVLLANSPGWLNFERSGSVNLAAGR